MLARTLIQQSRSTLLDPNQHLCWQGLWSNKVVQHCWIQTNTCAGKDSDSTKSFNVAGSKPILVLARTLIQQSRSTLLDPNQHLCWQGLWSNKVVQRKNNSRNVTKCLYLGNQSLEICLISMSFCFSLTVGNAFLKKPGLRPKVLSSYILKNWVSSVLQPKIKTIKKDINGNCKQSFKTCAYLFQSLFVLTSWLSKDSNLESVRTGQGFPDGLRTYMDNNIFHSF